MDNIKLCRIDFRLIHGQVITKWFGQIRGQEIVIVDDQLSEDEFMSSIYEMSAPPNSKVRVYSIEEACRKWNTEDFSKGRTLLLFKDVKSAHKAINTGMDIKEVQIGGLGSAPDRKVVFGPITLNDEDAKLLYDLEKNGVRVYFHQVPEEKYAELQSILKHKDFEI